jgi:alkylhydroperoxidase family enzyme
MHLNIHTLDSAPADSRHVLEGIAADLGLVPNLAAVAASAPALIAGFDGLRRAVAATKLDPVLREVAGLATGVAVDNHYGVAFHSTMLGRLGVNEADIAAMRAGGPPSDAVAAAVYVLSRQAALGRGQVPDITVQSASDAGLTTEDLLEVLLEVSFATMVGLIDNLAGHVPLDGFLVGPDGCPPVPSAVSMVAGRGT